MAKTGYANYLEWKAWSEDTFLHLSRNKRAYFDAETRRAGLMGKGLRVLELGFGDGAFLAYATEREWLCAGTELNDVLLERALQKGVEAYHASQDLKSLFEPASLDAVFAFDVFEHMEPEELEANLQSLRGLLKPRGRIVARFPSGDSPFSGAMFNGDLTHRTYLGTGKVEQLALSSGLHVELLAGAALPLRGVGLRSALARIPVHVVRKSVNGSLRLGYYNMRRRVLDPNMVAVLVRPLETCGKSC